MYDEFADLSENGAPHFRSGGGDDERQPRSVCRKNQISGQPMRPAQKWVCR